jgi:hypothetical protein
MKRLILLTAMVALAGCQSKPKIIRVPVAITCQTPRPAEPEYPIVAPEDGLFERARKLLVKEKLEAAYIEQLKAWGAGCNV